MGIFSWFSSRDDRGGRSSWFRRLVMPTGRPDPDLDDIKRAAEADVAEMEAEDRKYFRQYGPGNQEDDL